MRRAHLIVGIAGVIAFLGTGLYMDRGYEHLAHMADAPRMLFRSAHIYLLLSAAINVMLGLYLQLNASAGPRRLQQLGSLFILIGPPLLLAAFFKEPWLQDFERPFARPAIYSVLAGIVAHVLSRAWRGAPDGAQ